MWRPFGGNALKSIIKKNVLKFLTPFKLPITTHQAHAHNYSFRGVTKSQALKSYFISEFGQISEQFALLREDK